MQDALWTEQGSAVVAKGEPDKKGNCQQFEQDEDGALKGSRLVTNVTGIRPFEGQLSYQLGDHRNALSGSEPWKSITFAITTE